MLRALGYEVPSPIATYHNWGGVAPFSHQITTSELLVEHERGYILNDPGTGKTRSVISALDWMGVGATTPPALVVAPLSIVMGTWVNEVFKWAPHKDVIALVGTKEKRRKLLNEPADIYVINYDGLKVLERELLAKDWSALVLDECTAIKNASTTRWKILNKLARKVPRVYGMTGTPMPQSPLDAYGQLKLITPSDAVKYKRRFQLSVMEQVSTFKWVPLKDAEQTIFTLMQPAVRFKSSDCITLPDMVFAERSVQLSAKQRAAYKLMEKQLRVDIANERITAANSAVKMGKLIQIASGFLYDEDHKAHDLDPSNRLAELDACLQQTSGKTVVFAGTTAAVNLIHAHLSKTTTVEKVDGSTSAQKRGQIFNDFQNAADPQVIVAQERTISHGLTLTEADMIVWYTLPTSAEVFQQGCYRIHRPGQTRRHYVVSLIGTPLETQLLTRLKQRESAQNLLLDMYQQ